MYTQEKGKSCIELLPFINPGAFGSGEISRVVQIMNKYPDTTIKVIGYTDSTGSEAYNQQLSRSEPFP
jgi:hypothetical protein